MNCTGRNAVQCLPNAATKQPFLPSPEEVASCGVPLGQLSPLLLEDLHDSALQYPQLADPKAIGGASESEFKWAWQVRLD